MSDNIIDLEAARKHRAQKLETLKHSKLYLESVIGRQHIRAAEIIRELRKSRTDDDLGKRLVAVKGTIRLQTKNLERIMKQIDDLEDE